MLHVLVLASSTDSFICMQQWQKYQLAGLEEDDAERQ